MVSLRPNIWGRFRVFSVGTDHSAAMLEPMSADRRKG
jgi:hypothetical protein